MTSIGGSSSGISNIFSINLGSSSGTVIISTKDGGFLILDCFLTFSFSRMNTGASVATNVGSSSGTKSSSIVISLTVVNSNAK